ncbi:MAG: hypothetical protein WCB46_08850 [Methanoregula sp.]
MTENPATPIPTSTVINETGDFAVVRNGVDTAGGVTTAALIGAAGRQNPPCISVGGSQALIIFVRSGVGEKAGFEIMS